MYLLLDLQSTPGAIVLSITYGIDIRSPDDQFLNASIDAAHAASVVLVPGKFIADTFPIRACPRARLPRRV